MKLSFSSFLLLCASTLVLGRPHNHMNVREDFETEMEKKIDEVGASEALKEVEEDIETDLVGSKGFTTNAIEDIIGNPDSQVTFKKLEALMNHRLFNENCVQDCSKGLAGEDQTSPVCGTNGFTYSNECVLETVNCALKENVKVIRKGPCVNEMYEKYGSYTEELEKAEDDVIKKLLIKCSEVCPEEDRDIQVCGSDGKTYDNSCNLMAINCLSEKTEEKKIKNLHRGKCTLEEFKKYVLVHEEEEIEEEIDDDSFGYSAAVDEIEEFITSTGVKGSKLNISVQNIELLMNHRLFNIDCSPKCDMAKIQKVCGDNGFTYDNKCVMDTYSCALGEHVKVKSEGDCADALGNFDDEFVKVEQKVAEEAKELAEKCVVDKCPTTNQNPVCGTDGRNYDSECILSTIKCVTKNSALKVLHEGPCVNKCSNECENVLKPICGSDGKVYPNRCIMLQNGCLQNIPITEGKSCPDFAKKESSHTMFGIPHFTLIVSVSVGLGFIAFVSFIGFFFLSAVCCKKSKTSHYDSELDDVQDFMTDYTPVMTTELKFKNSEENLHHEHDAFINNDSDSDSFQL